MTSPLPILDLTDAEEVPPPLLLPMEAGGAACMGF